MRTRVLTSWASRSRGDNVATTDPEWERGDPAPPRAGYRFSREEGLVLDPDLSVAPIGTVPLVRWFSNDRSDNYTTTHPSWREDGTEHSPVYRFARREGHVYEQAYAGTTPLVSWWSGARSDNYTTTHPSWREDGSERSLGYRLARREGYVRPATGTLPLDPPSAFGYGTRARRGTRALLVVLCDYADQTVGDDVGFYQALVDGAGRPNLARMFQEMSNGRFRWDPVRVVRIRFAANYSVATVPIAAHDVNVVRLARSQAGVDFLAYDGDGDGVVTREDLTILTVVAGGSSGGQTRTIAPTEAGGVRLQDVYVSATGDAGEISLYAHELVHSLDLDDHIYGPGAALNDRASLYAASYRRTDPKAGPVHLDPWNKMLAGWVEPRVVAFRPTGGVASLPAAQVSGVSPLLGPLVLHDPARGPEEFFVVEFRSRRPRGGAPGGGHDAAVLGAGVAIWYVRRNLPTGSTRNGLTVVFDWPPPVVQRVGGNMVANYLIGPAGPGRGPFWTPEHGVAILPWGDGSDSGLRLRVGPLTEDATYAHVQWWHRDHPFLPRVDSCTPARLTAGSRTPVVLEGMFPIDETVQITLESDDAGTARTVGRAGTSVGMTRLVTSIVVPDDPGLHQLRVRRSDGSTSNGCLVQVG